MAARIYQVNVSPGGVPKKPVPYARVTPLGLEGDAVAHPKIHGGPERAVCLYSRERIDALRAEGHAIFPGAIGENLTIEGLDWSLVKPGDRFVMGDVVLEVTKYTTPCRTTAPYVSGDLERYDQKHTPGWSRVYARVVREGVVESGMPVEHRPSPPIPIDGTARSSTVGAKDLITGADATKY